MIILEAFVYFISLTFGPILNANSTKKPKYDEALLMQYVLY